MIEILARYALAAFNSTLLDEGDLSGFVIGTYTDVVGDLFWGLVFLGCLAPIYIRTQNLGYVSILWVILGALLEMAVPAEAMSLGKILIILGLAVLLYRVFVRSGE